MFRNIDLTDVDNITDRIGAVAAILRKRYIYTCDTPPKIRRPTAVYPGESLDERT